MTFEQILSRFLAFILWVPILFFSVLLSHNAILYFTHGGEYGILPEKLVARHDIIWNISFYIHLPTGILCLLSPIFLFSRLFVKRAMHLHQLIGKMYVWVTLLLVCPTGMYLALYAKGGLITQAGFMLQGILLAWFTYCGYQSIIHKNKSEHVRYMIRSYAVATVVLTFRIYHILFFLWKVPYQDNYAISQWLGITGNLLLAEIIILFLSHKVNSSQNLKSKSYETA
jgi:hypothetical protein